MKKQIVFVEVAPSIASFKVAKILKEKGYETILISFLKFKKDFYKSAYSKIIDFNLNAFTISIKNGINILLKSPRILKKISKIKRLNPAVVIGTATPRPLWLPALTRKIIKKTPFIFFPYDVNALKFIKKESYKKAGVPNFELKSEKYLFENSDGIIFKGEESELVKKKFNVKCPTISFPPYCSDEFIVPINKNKLSKKDEEIHLAYIGCIGNLASFELESEEDSINRMLKQKIHLHIYNKQCKQNLKIYNKFLKNKYFHLHKPLGAIEIVKEISKYDFGLCFCKFNFAIVNKEFAKVSSANKIASYLEAGLPPILNKELEFGNKILKKYGLDNNIKEDERGKLREKLEKLNSKKLEKSIILARKDYNMEKNFPRLKKFIEGLIKK
jgi:hypothetical protein